MSAIKLPVVSAIFCLLSAHASADVLSEIERFNKCLRVAAIDLDDAISTASDIASAAAEQCASTWQSVLIASNESLLKMDAYPSPAVQRVALRTVLDVRKEAAEAKKKSASQPPTPPKKQGIPM